MKDPIGRHFDQVSRHTVFRGGGRLLIVVIFAGLSRDFPTAFWLFALVTSVICSMQALQHREQWFGPSFNRWDEALFFLFVALVSGMLIRTPVGSE